MSFDDLPPQTPINPNADAYAATALELSRKAAAEVPCTPDVPYGPDYWQRMDIYRPAGGLTGLPVMIFFHGGNFTHGYKEWCGFMAPAITAFPAVFVSASYRLAPHTPYREILRDAFAALAELRRLLPEHGGDSARVFVAGHSAGGQIAALMVQRDDWRAEAGLPAGCIAGALPISARYGRRLGEQESDPAYRVPPGVPDSPIELAPRGAEVPFLVAWGGKERAEVIADAEAFVPALRGAGVAVEAMPRPDHDHFSIHLDTRHPSDEWTQAARRMLTGGAAPEARQG